MSDSSSLQGLSALWRKHGTKILLVFAVAMLVFAFIRYRRNDQNQRMADVQTALTSAWQGVQQLRGLQYSFKPLNGDQMSVVQQVEADVNQKVQQVQDEADPAADSARLASASLARGDLYWAISHLPAFEATVSPASQPAKDYLTLAATAYGKVVSDYSSHIEPLTLARFGLAAVAEDRLDIAAARQQYQLIIDNAATAAPDKTMAVNRLAALNIMEKPMLLLPATQPVAAAITPAAIASTQPLSGTAGPLPPTTAPAATTEPATSPATRP